ncbi:MAG: hypothetical protein AAFR71_10890 [Pseudomonadota bacterium]
MADETKNVVSSALVDAVRKVKIAAAERNDVVVDMKEADRARLEILAQNLQPVFDDVPLDDDRFDFAISSGLQPRLWIDATAHVVMGRDRRLYRFVRDTRVGRVTIAEGNAVEPIAEAVTTYIAERLHERELAFAAEDEVQSLRRVAGVSSALDAPKEPKPAETKREQSQSADTQDKKTNVARTVAVRPTKKAGQTRASGTVLWLLGLFIGGGALLLLFRDAIFTVVQ